MNSPKTGFCQQSKQLEEYGVTFPQLSLGADGLNKKSKKYQTRGKKQRLKHSENLANLQEFLSFKQLFQLVIPENTSYFFLPSASLDEICSRTHFTPCYKAHVCRLLYIIGTLRSNDVDGNKNVKKTIGLISPNNNFARASRFFEHFFPVFARPQRENA